MTSQPLAPDKLLKLLKQRATDLGFDAFGVVDASSRPDLPQKLDNVLSHQWHAGMEWMEETKVRRASPNMLWSEVKSIIVLGMSYTPKTDPLADLNSKSAGNISIYARNRDYHQIIKGRLKELAGLLARKGNAQVKVFVDTAPVMEKPLAQNAGLGWQGKNTVLTSREHGSWLFLGEIYTDLVLPASAPHAENCGSCTACLDICPTNAFPAPFRLDARKCLAYYNNEHHGPIPVEFRKAMGNRIFGCDDCLAVCPWNKFAKIARETKLIARQDLTLPPLGALVDFDDEKFRTIFSGSPMKRLGHSRFLRNVLIAIGNSGDLGLIDGVKNQLGHIDPMVRGAAVWALQQLVEPQELESVAKSYSLKERDEEVLKEWRSI